MRRRRSSNASSGKSTWKGRIATPDFSVVADIRPSSVWVMLGASPPVRHLAPVVTLVCAPGLHGYHGGYASAGITRVPAEKAVRLEALRDSLRPTATGVAREPIWGLPYGAAGNPEVASSA